MRSPSIALAVTLALTAYPFSSALAEASKAPAPTPMPPVAATPDGTPCDFPYVCNHAPDEFSIAIGHGAATDGGTAIGLNSYATGTGDATAIGGRANASGSGSVAIGDSASAAGYHAIRQAKYARRYLGEAAYRFNRRFRLREMLPRLLHAMIVCSPCTEPLLRQASNFLG